MIRIVLVEDQAMLRDSLACTINAQQDMEVVASLANAADALEATRRTGATCALLDVCTENDSSGIVAARLIKEELPDVRVVVMTGLPEITFVERAREAGVDSFVYKNVGTSELLGIIRSTMRDCPGTLLERGNGQATHLRDSRQDRLRQHPAPGSPRRLQRSHRPRDVRQRDSPFVSFWTSHHAPWPWMGRGALLCAAGERHNLR